MIDAGFSGIFYLLDAYDFHSMMVLQIIFTEGIPFDVCTSKRHSKFHMQIT